MSTFLSFPSLRSRTRGFWATMPTLRPLAIAEMIEVALTMLSYVDHSNSGCEIEDTQADQGQGLDYTQKSAPVF